MKIKILLLAFFLLSLKANSQEIILEKYCEIDNGYQSDTIYAMPPSQSAQLVIDTLLRFSTVSKGTVEFYAADVEKAIAAFQNGKRIIYFNEEYLDQIQEDRQTRWTVYFILAHELAHHTNMDALENDSQRRNSELEADCVAGKVLALMGATKEETLTIIESFNKNGTKTHPRRQARRARAYNCWKDAKTKFVDENAPYKLPRCPNGYGELKVINKTGEKYRIKIFVSGDGDAAKQTKRRWGRYSQDYSIGEMSTKRIKLPKGTFMVGFHQVASNGWYEQIPKKEDTIVIQSCKGVPVIVEE